MITRVHNIRKGREYPIVKMSQGAPIYSLFVDYGEILPKLEVGAFQLRWELPCKSGETATNLARETPRVS